MSTANDKNDENINNSIISRVSYESEYPIVRINVSGTIFETTKSTLSNYPNSLLGDPYRIQSYWNSELNAYFFNRDPEYFEEILSAYQQWPCTELHKMDDVVEFLEELLFFDMGPILTERVLQSYKLTLVRIDDCKISSIKDYCWNFLENPDFTFNARIFSNIRRIVMVLSAISSLLTSVNITHCSFSTFGIVTNELAKFVGLLLAIKSPFNIIDIVSSLFILTILLTMILSSYSTSTIKSIQSLNILRMICVCQALQLYKLYRYNDFMGAFSFTIKSHFLDILVVIIVIQLIAIFFGQMFIFAENLSLERNFTSIDGIWWSMVTIGTVGYGDITPKTMFGKFAAVLCIFVSRVIFTMLIPIFADIYLEYISGLELSRKFTSIVVDQKNIIVHRKVVHTIYPCPYKYPQNHGAVYIEWSQYVEYLHSLNS
ncbi:hypothetical protein GJ496_000546 [Pomphorhynchus laevis]|nr:hypothetical protein GJ496_000546 [Pomphorhynchus laevis]